MSQSEYIEILVNDLQMDRVNRNAICSRICSREIKYLDDMNGAERARVIDELKQLKLERKQRA